jgi:hypothetical protein
MEARAKIEKSCLAFTNQTTDGISTKLYRSDHYIPSCAHHWHILLRCTKWPPELKIEKSCPAFTDKPLVEFQQNFTGVISTIPSYA